MNGGVKVLLASVSAFVRRGPLRHERFRWLWIAGSVSFLGTWIHNVAARWTAATLSPSPLAVTAVDTVQVLPVVLLSIIAGRLADSVDRRRLLIATHAALTIVATVMAIVAMMGWLSMPSLLVLTALIGVFGALNGPSWQATVPRQVPDDEVQSAVALISMAFNTARTVGPAVGAWVLLKLGAPAAFLANAVSYGFIWYLFLKLPPHPPPSQALGRRKIGAPLGHPELRRLYVTVMTFGLFAMPSLSLLPIVARDGLGGGAMGFGALLTAFGAGAVCAGPFITAGDRILGYGKLVALSCLMAGGGLMLLALATSTSAAMVGAVLSGAGWIVTISTTNANVNLGAPDDIRGRAIAFFLMFAFFGQAAGSLMGGLAAQYLGLRTALTIFGALLWALAFAAYLAHPRFVSARGVKLKDA